MEATAHLTDAPDAPDDDDFEEPNPLQTLLQEPPPGWQIVRHVSGHPCYVHLKSRVCVHSPPYAVPDDVQLEAHVPPGVVRRALHSLPRGANSEASKRPRLKTSPPPPPLSPLSPPQQPAAPVASMPPAPLASMPPAIGSSSSSAAAETDPGRRPATIPSILLSELGPNGQKRAIHPGCPSFDIDITGKTPVSILNEYCPKVLKCPVEFIVTTQEDPVNPYLTTIVCEGIVVARAGYSSKRTSRQVCARAACVTSRCGRRLLPPTTTSHQFASPASPFFLFFQVAARKALTILAPLLDIGSADFVRVLKGLELYSC